MNTRTMDPKEAFLRGKAKRYTVATGAGLVHAEVAGGRVRVRRTKPRVQETFGKDTPANRRTAAETADLIQEGLLARDAGERGEEEGSRITVRDVWLKYLGDKVAKLPRSVLAWGKARLVQHYQNMTPEARALAPALDSVYIVIQAARRMHRTGAAPLDASVRRLEPGHYNRHPTSLAGESCSPNTSSTDLSRWKTALRHCRREWPEWWGELGRPDEGIKAVPTSHIRPDEIDEEQAVRLIAALWERGAWRAWAAAVFASESGRRIGAIGAHRPGLHLDAPPLAASDFAEVDGVLHVTWRAGPSKGGAYGRGDETVPCTRALADVYHWLIEHQPNPLGPEHPILWAPEDPTKGVSYEALTSTLDDAWRAAFEKDRPKGVAWHAFVRGCVTTIADMLGAIAAGEYSGRTAETVLRRYKRTRAQRQQVVARALDEARGRTGERSEDTGRSATQGPENVEGE